MNNYDLFKRYSSIDLEKDFQIFHKDNPFIKALNLVNSMVLILNETRQIVFANMEIIKRLGYSNLSEVLGRRTGEIVSCLHSSKGESGCGTSKDCEDCDTLKIFLKTIQNNDKVTDIVRMITKSSEIILPLDIEMSAEIYNVNAHEYMIVNLIDINGKIRKLEMESIFYHDILNNAGGIKGLLQLISADVPESCKENFELVNLAIQDLVEVIEVQRKFSFLDEEIIELDKEVVNSLELINNLKQFFVKMDEGYEGRVIVDLESVDVNFVNDIILLKRILHNMIKNGIEAINSTEIVTIGCHILKGNVIEFWVYNPGFIDELKRKKIFNKRFSTKGYNRGWGTLSMKILGENLLNGKVDYETDKVKGTKFYIRIPLYMKGNLNENINS